MPVIDIETQDNVEQVETLPPSEMTDDELHDHLTSLCADAADIREQLNDEMRTDEDWRFRARDALRYKVRDFELARAEARLRGMGNLPLINPELERLRLKDLAKWQSSLEGQEKHKADVARAQAEKAAREVAKAEQHRLTMAAEALKFQGKACLFVQAAKEMMSLEERKAIWEKAKELFPDNPCWADIAPRKAAATVQQGEQA